MFSLRFSQHGKFIVCYYGPIGSFQLRIELMVSIIRLEGSPEGGSSSAFRIRLLIFLILC
jgi:hypothetical protein